MSSISLMENLVKIEWKQMSSNTRENSLFIRCLAYDDNMLEATSKGSW